MATSGLSTHLENTGKFHNLAKNRYVLVEQEGNQNCKGVCILRERNRYRIYENGDHDSTTSACENHGNEIERQGGVLAQTSEDIRALRVI